MYYTCKTLRQCKVSNVDKIHAVQLMGEKVIVAVNFHDDNLDSIMLNDWEKDQRAMGISALLEIIKNVHDVQTVHRNLHPQSFKFVRELPDSHYLSDFQYATSTTYTDVEYHLPSNPYCNRGAGWASGSKNHDLFAIGSIILGHFSKALDWKDALKSIVKVKHLARKFCDNEFKSRFARQIVQRTVLADKDLMDLCEITACWYRSQEEMKVK